MSKNIKNLFLAFCLMFGIGFETTFSQKPLNLQEVIEKIDQLDSQFDLHVLSEVCIKEYNNPSLPSLLSSEESLCVNIEKCKKLKNTNSRLFGLLEFSIELRQGVYLLERLYSSNGDAKQLFSAQFLEKINRVAYSSCLSYWLGGLFLHYFFCQEIAQLHEEEGSFDLMLDYVKKAIRHFENYAECGFEELFEDKLVEDELLKLERKFPHLFVVRVVQLFADGLKDFISKDMDNFEGLMVAGSPLVLSRVEKIVQDMKNSPEYNKELLLYEKL